LKIQGFSQITDYDKLILELGTTEDCTETALTQASPYIKGIPNIFISQEGEIAIKEKNGRRKGEKNRSPLWARLMMNLNFLSVLPNALKTKYQDNN
jgi:hypothetical protein